jgi:hypothetical protein
MSYIPPPGSVPYRAIAHLQKLAPGAEVKTSVLAEAINAPPASMNTCMEPARAAGLVFARQRDVHRTSPMWWSLVDHTKQETPPKGANRAATGFEGRAPQGADATDSEARSKVMAAEGSERPTARGENVAPALGAAPAFLRADPDGAAAIAGGAARPEETAQRGAGSADIAATRETATGAGDDAKPAVGAAAPDGPTRFALWSDGTLHIQRPRSGFVLTIEESRALVAYLDSISLDSVRGEGVAS